MSPTGWRGGRRSAPRVQALLIDLVQTQVPFEALSQPRRGLPFMGTQRDETAGWEQIVVAAGGPILMAAHT
jgi:hypothetical protein